MLKKFELRAGHDLLSFLRARLSKKLTSCLFQLLLVFVITACMVFNI